MNVDSSCGFADVDAKMAALNLKYNDEGLIPAIIQDEETNEVLMLAYMNEESLKKTIATNYTNFYSRSRRRLWQKGETSGHVQSVKKIFYDCDADTLLIKVKQTGAACHEGTKSCFSKMLSQNEGGEKENLKIQNCAKQMPSAVKAVEDDEINIIHELFEIIRERKNNPKEGSYTTYLFEKGRDKILKKIGEESAETIIASKNNDKREIIYETADLWYHCLVLLSHHDITPKELFRELKSRRK